MRTQQELGIGAALKVHKIKTPNLAQENIDYLNNVCWLLTKYTILTRQPRNLREMTFEKMGYSVNLYAQINHTYCDIIDVLMNMHL